MSLHIIGKQCLITRRERANECLLNCVSLAGHQVDPKLFGQHDEIAPRMPIALGKLIDQLLDSGCGVGDDFLPRSLPQLYLSAKCAFQLILEVSCN